MGSPSSSDSRFVKAAMQAPYLAHDEEKHLAVRWREERDTAALHALTAAHMRLVVAIAARFRHYGLPMADLVQEGNVGLLEAAARFEPGRDIRFSTYATWWIRAAVQDFVLRNWSIVRGGTSSAQKALFFNLRRLRAKLAATTDTVPNGILYQEIALAIGVSREDVELMDARLSGSDGSLNAPAFGADDASSEQQDFLVDEAPLPDEMVGEAIDGDRRTSWLKSAMAVLTPREEEVLRRRRLSDEAATLEALGASLGISKERVRQIENRAVEKLREVLLRDHPEAAISPAAHRAVCAA